MNIFKEKKKLIRYIVIMIILIIITSSLFIFFTKSPFVSSYTLEAGDHLFIEDLLNEDVEAKFITDINDSITCSIGEHRIELESHGKVYTVELNVVDTIAPIGEVKELTAYLNDEILPEDFFVSISDYTQVKATFVSPIVNNKQGIQNVELMLEDEGGNTSTYTTSLHLIKDEEAPVITAPMQINVVKGESVAYRKSITVIDNRDGVIDNYSLDSSLVNLNEVGSYKLKITAKDNVGHISSKDVIINVVDYDIDNVKNELKRYSQKIISQIVNDSMSRKEKIYAVYHYVKDAYTYMGYHQGTIDDYYLDALYGFKNHKGDCYVVNAMARYLLEEMGIETYGVVIKGESDTHIFFMADNGDGWYYYSSLRRGNKTEIYQWTDRQVLSYLNKWDGVTSLHDGEFPNTPNQ